MCVFLSVLCGGVCVAEFWTRIHHLLKPSPDSVHYLLTHFHWLWDLVNSSFLRNVLMRVVLTGTL